MLGWPEDPVIEVARCSWPAALQAAISGKELRCFFQPIVDIRRGSVVGYEALARILGPSGPLGPRPWLAAARAHGVRAELEAACATAALAHRSSLPAGCFLSVNVGPEVLAHPLVQEVLGAQGDLSGIVLELTERTPVEAYADLDPVLAHYRRAGARIAVDAVDAVGRGEDGLKYLEDLEPSIVRLDRSLVADIDRDEAKRGLVQMLGTLAQRMGACLLAEGVERVDELDALADLPVDLVQGYALAKPSPTLVGIEADLALRLRVREARADGPADRVLRPSPAGPGAVPTASASSAGSSG
jgi:EAL domain-containing protein (putative c-di-GMP-specific phosphodiesterase class I)